MAKCKHGASQNDGRYKGVWAAPFDRCDCCGTFYPYIDMGYWTPDKSYTRTWTKGKCPSCGGRYEEDGDLTIWV